MKTSRLLYSIARRYARRTAAACRSCARKLGQPIPVAKLQLRFMAPTEFDEIYYLNPSVLSLCTKVRSAHDPRKQKAFLKKGPWDLYAANLESIRDTTVQTIRALIAGTPPGETVQYREMTSAVAALSILIV